MDPFETEDLFEVFGKATTSSNDNEQQQKKRTLEQSIKLAETEQEERRELKKLKQLLDEDEGYNKEMQSADSDEITNNNTKSNGGIHHGETTTLGGAVVGDENFKNEERKVNKLIGRLGEKNDCLHEVAIPPNYDGRMDLLEMRSDVEMGLKEPAKVYPFQLDAFQREAVRAIELSQSVLVSAHTSAGKTAVAEYAIAKALKDGSRVVYTSPIKALSNQKFRELQEEFKDVGLMTGDVTINPRSSCIVMTTEILRSMLYRGSELLNEVSWVIFDEVHYMRDKERGVVWEETLILLPTSVRYVFLSATIPNAMEFAGWIAKLKGQPVHIVYTDYRPTPLQHYLYPVGGGGIHLVVEKHNFKEENFKHAIEDLNQVYSSGNSGQNGQVSYTERKKRVDFGLVKLVNMIMKKNFQPVIVFSFSRKDCESRAIGLSKSNFNDEEEMALVQEVFTNAIDSLSEDDKKLPQVESMLPLLKKGIGIHHSGLLPIIKEVIEILFQEGLIKVLFATETFAMGLNMPAKTVIFTGVEKFDGVITRTLTSGEYIQMSGRAGRRGLDDKGIVILMLDDPNLREEDARQLMNGIADPLNSSFHLSYYMVLNLLRVEELTPEYIMERSFYQFQCEKKKSHYEQKLEELKLKRDSISLPNEPQLASYVNLLQELKQVNHQYRTEITTPRYIIPYLSAGRLVKIKDWGWGILLKFTKKRHAEKLPVVNTVADDYDLELLLAADPDNINNVYVEDEDTTNVDRLPVPIIKTYSLSLVEGLSTVKIYLSKQMKTHPDSTSEEAQTAVIKFLETNRRLKQKNTVILLDPITDMSIPKEKIQPLRDQIQSIEDRLKHNPYSKKVKSLDVAQYEEKLELEMQIRELQKLIKSTSQLVMKDELKKMARVLRRLGFVSEDNVITAKGRVACELSSADALVVTEMIYNGAFTHLTPEQCIAVLSCFASEMESQKREDDKSALIEELQQAYFDLEVAAKRVAEVSLESKLELDLERYLSSFPCNLMNVTYAWCTGAKFVDICKMTEIFEGSIVRIMRRCEEVVRQMCAAAKSIGEETLEKKLLIGLDKMRRDIVFSSSLYL
ncbi:hypothetical protein ABK040_007973 [Willaertia magna]